MKTNPRTFELRADTLLSVCAALAAVVWMILIFAVGMTLTLVGWSMTGKLLGLGLMLVGIVLMLTALFVYNAPYKK